MSDIDKTGPTKTGPRDWRAEQWVAYIKRGASGGGPRGTESGGEYLIVEAAGTVLPSGDPVLMLLHRFSLQELADIQRAMDMLGHDGWYYPVKRRARKDGQAAEKRGIK